jgi:sulfate adenylyltransferase subunit 1
MKVLKIATAGSVDDGKSTLIGRILYDTKSLTDDKLEAIEQKSSQRGFDYLDFSLATDGLVAEREQGITIDVAHIYFSTPSKSFIIADTPGYWCFNCSSLYCFNRCKERRCRANLQTLFYQ